MSRHRKHKHTDWLEARLVRLAVYAGSRCRAKRLRYENALIQWRNNVRRRNKEEL